MKFKNKFYIVKPYQENKNWLAFKKEFKPENIKVKTELIYQEVSFETKKDILDFKNYKVIIEKFINKFTKSQWKEDLIQDAYLLFHSCVEKFKKGDILNFYAYFISNLYYNIKKHNMNYMKKITYVSSFVDFDVLLNKPQEAKEFDRKMVSLLGIKVPKNNLNKVPINPPNQITEKKAQFDYIYDIIKDNLNEYEKDILNSYTGIEEERLDIKGLCKKYNKTKKAIYSKWKRMKIKLRKQFIIKGE